MERLNPLLHKDPAIILPPEMTALIFLHLSPADLLKSSIASRSWRERTLDSNLWRVLFGREGWSANMAEIRQVEKSEARRRIALDRRSSPKAARRKRDIESEGSGTTKRARESSDKARSARNIQGWLEQHGTPEADDDMVMHEDASSASQPWPSSRNTPDSSTGSQVSAPLALSPPLVPELFTSATDSPRINWLYLYKQRRRLEDNWRKGRYATFQLPHPDHPEEAHDECVYTIQHSRKWLVSGSRDRSIAIWDLDTQRRVRTLTGAHLASVLCLQFDEREGEDIVVSGGSDSFVVIWRFSTGEIIRKMDQAHTESVLNLRFDDRYLITCSKDKTIKIFNRKEVFTDDPIVPAAARRQFEIRGMNPIPEYNLLITLEGHGAAVNAIQVYEGQVVSASGDRTIKAWDINTGHCIRTYTGHTKGIACVHFDGRRIVSGSSDNTVRIFDAATSAEVACLPGHTNLVRTVQARFGDLHDTDQELEAAARAVDRRFHDARTNGQALDQRRRRGIRNAGSSDPNDICAIGAKIPPGGGGNAWSRIVSGSYDETVIIWRKDADGKWVTSRRLHQDEVLHSRSRRPRPNAPHAQGPRNAVHNAPQQAHQAQVQTAATRGSTAPAAVHGTLPPVDGTQGQASTINSARRASSNTAPGQPHTHVGQAGQASQATESSGSVHQPAGRTPAAHTGGHHTTQGQHRSRDESNHVFKLQFDSRRIVCCSQNRVIVGWDFAAGDVELAEASRYFGDTN